MPDGQKVRPLRNLNVTSSLKYERLLASGGSSRRKFSKYSKYIYIMLSGALECPKPGMGLGMRLNHGALCYSHSVLLFH